MKWVMLKAEAETAIALPRRPEAGNLYECLPEIPGTTLRGALAARFLAHNNCVKPDLFENSAIRFGPLRPLPEDVPFSTPCVAPVPRSARSCKYVDGLEEEGHGVVDILRQAGARIRLEEAPKCGKCQAPLEPLEKAWLVANWTQNQGYVYDPLFQLSTHVGIGKGGIAEEGRLFSLQHFPAGTKFVGWIALGIDGDEKDFLRQLGFTQKDGNEWAITLRVGRRSKSLGALKVKAIPWQEPPWQKSHGSAKKRWDDMQNSLEQEDSLKGAIQETVCNQDFYLLSLTCLTETILLDGFLRPYRVIPTAYLAQRLCLPEEAIYRLASFTRTRLVAGWHAAHKLPKPPDTAIIAGSVFLFAIDKRKVPNEQKQELLQRLCSLEETGIGWRRSEGFGQVLFCDPWHLVGGDGKVHLSCTRKPELPAEQRIAEAKEVSAMLEANDPMREFLCQNAKVFWAEKPLTRTQLTGLREFINRLNVVAQSQPNEAVETLKEHFEHLKQRFKPGEKWAARVKTGKGLAEAVLEVLTEGEADWQTIHQRALFFVTMALLAMDAQEKKSILQKEAWQKLVKGE